MPVDKQLQQEIKDAKYALKGCYSRIRMTRTTLDNEQFYLSQVLHLKKTIKRAQDELVELEHIREHGEKFITQAHDEAGKLMKRIVTLKNRRQIEAIKKLHRQLNALETDQ